MGCDRGPLTRLRSKGRTTASEPRYDPLGRLENLTETSAELCGETACRNDPNGTSRETGAYVRISQEQDVVHPNLWLFE
jgi:hypothetical protein